MTVPASKNSSHRVYLRVSHLQGQLSMTQHLENKEVRMPTNELVYSSSLSRQDDLGNNNTGCTPVSVKEIVDNNRPNELYKINYYGSSHNEAINTSNRLKEVESGKGSANLSRGQNNNNHGSLGVTKACVEKVVE